MGERYLSRKIENNKKVACPLFLFPSGNYENAYSIWEASASKGNRDSVYAIAVANESLKQKLDNQSLPQPERKAIEMVLEKAPEIKEKNGIYFLEKAK